MLTAAIGRDFDGPQEEKRRKKKRKQPKLKIHSCFLWSTHQHVDDDYDEVTEEREKKK